MKLFRSLTTARRELPRLWPLLRDVRVPLWAKIAAGLVAAFIISPLNFLGDIPLLGFLDDAALLMIVSHYFVSFAEKHIARTDAGPAMRTVPPASSALRNVS